jgi:hypothetical protein
VVLGFAPAEELSEYAASMPAVRQYLLETLCPRKEGRGTICGQRLSSG